MQDMATVKVLVVAGGGSGGGASANSRGAGGGGAGGFLYNAAFVVTAQAYTITVGDGGTGGIDAGNSGSNSVFSTMTATGGGKGASESGVGATGGSGGGGYGGGSGYAGTGGQGNTGGNGLGDDPNRSPGGGGGGASAVGANAAANAGGAGGAGTANSITGSSVTYAGGGGGGLLNVVAGGTTGAGGAGGGGAGGVNTGGAGVNGTANTGGGGGGSSCTVATGYAGGNGGSGVVIFSYVTADFGTCTGGTITTDGANTVHKFTTSGDFTVVLNTALSINVFDSVTAAETITPRLKSNVNIFDSITVSEYAHPTRGPIDFDAASSSAYQAALSSYSWSHTTAGSNRLLIVAVSIFAAGTVSSITYNGVNLSFLRSDATGVYRTEMWFMVAPTIGTNTVVVNLSTSLTSIGSAVSYIGVDQSTPIENSDGGVGLGNPASDAITTFTDLDWVANVLATSATAVTAGQNSRVNNTGALGSGAMEDQASISPAGVVTLTWTGLGALDNWTLTEAAIKPVNTVTTTREVEVYDSINVSESTTPQERFLINVFDSINVSENIQTQKVNTVNVFDSATVSENIQAQQINTVSVFDSVQVSENIQTQKVLTISVFDSVIVSESTTSSPVILPQISDNITVSESVGIFQNLFAFTANWTKQTDTSTNWEVTE